MSKKVELPDTQLQKVTLLVTMHDHDPDDLDAGEWLANVLLAGMNKQSTSAYAAKAYLQAMQVLSVENCEVVVSDVI